MAGSGHWLMEERRAETVAPGGIITVAGTETSGELLDRASARPAGPAGQGIVTCPAAVWPPITWLGLIVNCGGPIGRICRAACRALVLKEAEIDADWSAAVTVVTTEKRA